VARHGASAARGAARDRRPRADRYRKEPRADARGARHRAASPIPLFVLTRGHPNQPGSNPRLDAADERLWRHLQDEIAALVPHSKHATAKRSGHDIQHEQPRLVIAAIHHVVQAVRDPASWKPR
jgi:hypothetical protein